MSWYDDLYRANKVLNDIVSPLVTTNVALCFPLTVFLILVTGRLGLIESRSLV